MKSKIKLICVCCNKPFDVLPGYYNQCINKGIVLKCSKECSIIYRTKQRDVVNCMQCNKLYEKLPRNKTKFCSQSCSATYNNTHKTHGIRISKLENWLQFKLLEKYLFEIHFNKKDAINSELDIYIPHLKLAFELNGIFHYEPIYSPEQLSKIQNNDNRKFQACIERGIELCIMDTSKQKYFKDSTSQQFLDIITIIIDKHISTGHEAN